MSCTETAQVRQFLAGSLSRKATLWTLDHVRECEDCRAVMTAESRLGARQAQPEASPRLFLPSTNDCSYEDEEEAPAINPWTPASEGFHAFGGSQRKSLLRRAPLVRLAALGLCIALLMNGKSLFGDKEAKAPTALEILVAAAISEGRPFCDAPKGAISSRPKVMSLTLPPGERKFRVQILRDGTVVYDSQLDRKDKEVYFEEISVRRPEGTLPALEVLFPFPSATELPLEPGAEYFWLVRLPNGNQSAPIAVRME
ncbi:MAG: hypothetical protein V3W41_18445 [Planctomycetota bacterium]